MSKLGDLNFLGSDREESNFDQFIKRGYPAHVRALVKLLDDLDTERGATANALNEKRERLSAKMANLRRDIGRAERVKASGVKWSPEHEAQLKEDRAELEEALADRAKLDKVDAVVRISPERRNHARLFAALTPSISEHVLACGPRARFEAYRADASGYSIKSVRAESEKVIDALVKLETAPLSCDEALAAMRREVDRMAAKGAPKVAGLYSYRVRNFGSAPRQGSIAWPEDVLASGRLADGGGVQLGTAFSVWLHKDAVEKRLAAEIKERFADTEGVTAKDRQAEEAKLKARFMELARIEARLCHAAEDAGKDVDWRRLPPEAFLEIRRIDDAAQLVAPDAGGLEMPAGSSPTLGVTIPAEVAGKVAVTGPNRTMEVANNVNEGGRK
jgi:hypothetical protein